LPPESAPAPGRPLVYASPPPMWMLIDNSNHTTKIARASDQAGPFPGSLARIPSAGLDAAGLDAFAAAGPAVQGLAFCSVTRAGPPLLRAWAAGRGLPCLEIDHTNAGLDFTGYPDPATIGPDRLANALAAATRFPGRAVIAVDCGTAAAFSVVVPGGGGGCPRFLGGPIAPGLGLFTSWPAGRADRLPGLPAPVPGEPVPALARSTADALRAGARFGFAGQLREILAALDAELQAAGWPGPAIVATGSDAAAAAAWLGAEVLADPWLTLRGLALAMRARFAA
jgi:type III pantothenate kinase